MIKDYADRSWIFETQKKSLGEKIIPPFVFWLVFTLALLFA